MKRTMNKANSSSPKVTKHRARPTRLCSSAAPCPKCALFMVITLCFRIFELRYRRRPNPDEPLFFDPTKDRPVAAGLSQVMEQIHAAASELGIDEGRVLQFLNLDSSFAGGGRCPPPDQSSALNAMPPGRHKRVRLIRRDCGSTPGKVTPAAQPAVVPGRPGVWERFMSDQETHRRYNITAAELSMLSQAALMCEVLDWRDFIFILETVRRSGGD